MGPGTNNLQVRKINRNRVFRYINSVEKTSMPEIASALRMSTPTVLGVVKELLKEGIVEEVGEFGSTGGRKAKAYAARKDTRYSIGVDLTKNHVGITYTDFTQQAKCHERVYKPFEDTADYFQEVARLIRKFVEENQIDQDKILGMAMAVPGIVDEERGMITASHALGIHGVSLDKWKDYLPYPCKFTNDANAAAIAECAVSDIQGNMLYLLLSNTVGGAARMQTLNGGEGLKPRLYLGDNWRSCEFGHMVIRPEGNRCYCGKIGCLDTYCSALRLAEQTEGNLERFFVEMEEGNEKYRRIFAKYLDDLTIAVDNLRMQFDCRVILGGYVGCYLEPYIHVLQEKMRERDIFGSSGDYVMACRSRKEASALGGAVLVMEEYLESV
ncbi:ROK family transcriptional regulator [Clostridiaceae bacterium 68-1-5]|uniref:ROK family transcriptional regulator n=1 Tax=Suipraeoptans intestinalis TaxID=2606628 RepID=A0A6N7USK3_9FIRM|nr:ROK family transcriptional regulator [Suipraeoptans intestinalis]MSR94033.1 ROK family transcriptional regulator [Suipraeoptans intestinalis]